MTAAHTQLVQSGRLRVSREGRGLATYERMRKEQPRAMAKVLMSSFVKSGALLCCCPSASSVSVPPPRPLPSEPSPSAWQGLCQGVRPWPQTLPAIC